MYLGRTRLLKCAVEMLEMRDLAAEVSVEGHSTVWVQLQKLLLRNLLCVPEAWEQAMIGCHYRMLLTTIQHILN